MNLVDSHGRTIQLGTLIGKGGEGSVYTVHGNAKVAAKIYHRTPLPADDVAKYEAMVACRSQALDTISAWPQAVLYNSFPAVPCGLLMPRVVEARHLHELYGTWNRRRHFPEVQWQHLVWAARNVAAAFEEFHKAGIVVGDVNQGNLLIDREMRVRFIDCDSFQINGRGRMFMCPVGTPHFTPPELQSKSLRQTPRTPDHDCFGMAVLIFHLLFVGRHPFAGRFQGAGEMTIEKAIAQRRFAFSRNKGATLVEPPPFSLLLEDIPESIGELFEQAFRGDPKTKGRPTARQWFAQLVDLSDEMRSCSFHPAHVYYGQLKQCPWCRIEDVGGPEFFVLGDGVATISQRLAQLEDRLRGLSPPSFPHLAQQQLKIPQELEPPWTAGGAKTSLPDAAAALLTVSAFLSLLGILSGWALLAATLGAGVAGGLLLWSKQGKARRDTLAELRQRLQQHQSQLQRRAEAVRASHRQRQAAFDACLAELRAGCQHYLAADTQLKDVLAVHQISERNRFLAAHLIQAHVADIPGLTFPLASILQSYGVDSALDIDPLLLQGVRMLSPVLSMELTHWREHLEREFVYEPEHGVTVDRVNASEDIALIRFKIFQAQRIFKNVQHVNSLASEASAHLARETGQFYELAAPTRQAVLDLRDFQNGRSSMERLLNRSPAVILGAVLAVPVIGGLVSWLFPWLF